MNATPTTILAEDHPAPLVRELLAVEPRLAALMSSDDLEIHVLRFIRHLRISSERDALARKDVVT